MPASSGSTPIARARRSLPSAAEIARQVPSTSPLLIETFGGPFSPLNETESQIDLIRELALPTVLISSSKIGAMGRTLAMLRALRAEGIVPTAVVLMGEADEHARARIAKESGLPVAPLHFPSTFDASGIRESASKQASALNEIVVLLSATRPVVDHREADRQFVWHPYTPLRGAEPPLEVIGAREEFLHLADGRKVIDAISSWWTILHGHLDPHLMGVLEQASRSFDHVLFAGVTHAPAIRVAELLLQTTLWSGGRVFFSENGSTAVEVALKMAYQVWRHRGEPNRTLFVGFEDGYHGDTFGAMSVGRDPLFFGNFEPLLFKVERVPVSAERLDEVLTRQAGKVAAVIIEPLVQGAGGMRMHSPWELRAIYEVTRKHGVLFIADEVMTGCHRTGPMWAFQAAGISPDLICTAKTLAGGILPLAATLASPAIVEAFDTADREKTFFHGHSFTAHPLACSLAAANLERLRNEPPTAPARFQQFWNETFAELRGHPRVRDVRVRGTIAAIELEVPGGYLAKTAQAMRACCLEQGVFLRPLGNVLYALPPFGTREESLRRIAAAMKKAVEVA
ncbi:MAG: adenosylmethionine--8-amino-7-oxononanoate transaminase [Planctomycetes bacterium]|nr:adenosylmethionine--8-amino-7-oxononanoate transaminase [Planctomycetota bacterium]